MKFWIFALLAIPIVVFGQEELDSTKSFRFSVSPSAFINVYPGLQVGVEKKVFSRDYLELEVAYLFPVKNNSDFRTSGYRIKAGYKVQNLVPDLRTTFIFFYRQTSGDRVEDFSRFDDLFFQQVDFRKTKSLIGFTVGLLKELEYDDWQMQFGFSAGPGRYIVADKDVPVESEQISGIPVFSVYELEGTYFFPIISVQWKLLF